MPRRRRPPDVDRLARRRLPKERPAAVTELFYAHYGQLVRMARLLVDDKESAEDVVMDAFTSLYRRWHSIRDPDDAYRYLRSSVLNGARSHLRRRRLLRLRQMDTVKPEPFDAYLPMPTQPDVAVVGTNRATVVGLLRALPVRQRQVLVMRYLLDLSELEIADDLGISAGSVKTHASRGLAALARALEGTR